MKILMCDGCGEYKDVDDDGINEMVETGLSICDRCLENFCVEI